MHGALVYTKMIVLIWMDPFIFVDNLNIFRPYSNSPKTHLRFSFSFLLATLDFLGYLCLESSTIRHCRVIFVENIHQVGHVTGCQSQSLDLGQFSVRRNVWDAVTQRGERRVDAVRTSALFLVRGVPPFYNTDLRISFYHAEHSVRLRAGEVGIGTGLKTREVGMCRVLCVEEVVWEVSRRCRAIVSCRSRARVMGILIVATGRLVIRVEVMGKWGSVVMVRLRGVATY